MVSCVLLFILERILAQEWIVSCRMAGCWGMPAWFPSADSLGATKEDNFLLLKELWSFWFMVWKGLETVKVLIIAQEAMGSIAHTEYTSWTFFFPKLELTTNSKSKLEIFVIFSHLCASLQKTKNSDFRIPANINSGKSQFVCQIVIILFYKLNTISQINTCHKPLHAAASGPHAQNGYLKIKKTKQTVEVSYLLNSFLKHEVC